MKKTIKKLFDWTPRDVLAWENIRNQGFWHFVLHYDVKTFGMILFVLMGGITLIPWVLTLGSIVSLLFQLVLSGWVNHWTADRWMEDVIYQKIIKSRPL